MPTYYSVRRDLDDRLSALLIEDLVHMMQYSLRPVSFPKEAYWLIWLPFDTNFYFNN